MRANTVSARMNLYGFNRKRKPVNLCFLFIYENIHLDIMKTVQTLGAQISVAANINPMDKVQHTINIDVTA